jgi:soluble lytic murein transglycosylase-like protein
VPPIARQVRIALAALALAAPAGASRAQVLEIGEDGAVRRIGGGWSSAPDPAPALAAAPSAGRPFRAEFEAAARAYDLSPELLHAVARAESGYDPAAVSPAGAIGVMQLMPATARKLGVDPRDPAQNIMGGAAYLRAQLDRFDGAVDLALAAYNAGPGAVVRHHGAPPFRETQAYVARNLDRLAAQSLALNPHPPAGDAP